jgi:energy-coupling factor transporter transmembrane protein EcfT
MKEQSFFKDGELLVEKVQKHTIVYINDAIDQIFACSAFLLGAYFLGVYTKMIDAYGALFFLFVVLMFWLIFFYTWTQNYFDLWYITDKNIIALNQIEFFTQEISTMDLTNIQGLIYEQKGILQAWLGHGKLRIQSKGMEQDFVLNDVRSVELVANSIVELRQKLGATAVRGDNRDRRRKRRSVFGFYNICIYTFY